jgi:hypothetical protein
MGPILVRILSFLGGQIFTKAHQQHCLEHQHTFLFTFSIVAISGGEFGQNGAFKKGDD